MQPSGLQHAYTNSMVTAHILYIKQLLRDVIVVSNTSIHVHVIISNITCTCNIRYHYMYVYM